MVDESKVREHALLSIIADALKKNDEVAKVKIGAKRMYVTQLTVKMRAGATFYVNVVQNE